MRSPIATYRLQLNSNLGFREVEGLLPYLKQLGISDLYASPIFQAMHDSSHGYDVTDPHAFNPELGTAQAFESLTQARQALAMGWVQDIVPNHMAYSSDNAFLMDVWERGPLSPYHAWFDIFWDHPDPALRDQLLAPVLGCPWPEALAQGQIKLILDDKGLAWQYYQWRFPLSLRSYPTILMHGLSTQGRAVLQDPQTLTQWTELSQGFRRLSQDIDSAQWHAQIRDHKRRLVTLCERHADLRGHLDHQLRVFSRPGPENEGLLQAQFGRPVFWQEAATRINYRRFFYLNDYIALRVEDPQVFAAVHERILALAHQGVFTGLRIDHLDGLYAPGAYLRRLRERLPETFLVAEKILELEENPPHEWPLQGTTGYQFGAYVQGLFCRPAHAPALTEIYHEFIDTTIDVPRELCAAKQEILQTHMAGELTYLTHLWQAASPTPYAPNPVRKALVALLAAFPVYRTYREEGPISAPDLATVQTAVQRAQALAPDCREILAAMEDVLCGPMEPNDAVQTPCRHFIQRLQQLSGPAMAKGFEDTLLYRYHRLVSLNEVGGDPTCAGISASRFHRYNQARAQDWPLAMNATSTHDSKRGEDIRARLAVLSEMPQRWQQTVTRWAAINRHLKASVNHRPAPDPNDEYLLYQTLLGAWPWTATKQQAFCQRLQDYLVKAVREAKVHSTWTQPHEAYETACSAFVERLWDRHDNQAFWSDFLPFQAEIAHYGVLNSLCQSLLKMTCPGIPDFYQGTELWDFNLVDPDNRRPVDFHRRQQMLDALPSGASVNWTEDLLTRPEDGRVKLLLTHKTLQVRARYAALFQRGGYSPVTVQGTRADHVIAFMRHNEDTRALVVVPRWLTAIAPENTWPLGQAIWKNTMLLPGHSDTPWYNALTGVTLEGHGTLPVGRLLQQCPVALLLSPNR